MVIQLFRSLRYHGSAQSGEFLKSERRVSDDTASVDVAGSGGRAACAPWEVLEYLTPEERKGCLVGSSREEARGLFNLSSQITSVLIATFVSQADASMLRPMGRDPGRSPKMARAILGYIADQLHPEFVNGFRGEMDMLSEIVDGYIKSGYVAELVDSKLARDMH